MGFIFWRVFLLSGLDLLFAFASFKFYFSKGANCKGQMKGWAKTMTKNKKVRLSGMAQGGKNHLIKPAFGELGLEKICRM